MGWTHLFLESSKSFLKKSHLSYKPKDELELEKQSKEEKKVFQVKRPQKHLDAGKNLPFSSSSKLVKVNNWLSTKYNMCISIHMNVYYVINIWDT